MEFRESQTRKAKFFTNGRADFENVEQMLRTFQTKRNLMSSIHARDAEAARRIFHRLPSDDTDGNYSAKDLANEIMDPCLSTPLHLAVKHGVAEIVEILLEYGAKPCRDSLGNF